MQLTSIIGLALPLSSVLVAATPVAGAPTIDPHKTVSTHSITPDGTCGSTKPGAYACKEGYCCSKWGWCGTNPEFCGDGCDKEYGACGIPTPTPTPHPISADGSCGPGSAGPYRCADGNCCSLFGWW
ncbi:hypothetical protein PG996_004709 [Apiospora saccharicola]|uniref:Chitin-binding type-1 domain-containing protein n=1 Tax=Apiospora saccharicola TaxID=335842 RepID=A0ABR1W4X8_9PEZI